jgi:hypothetical protein
MRDIKQLLNAVSHLAPDASPVETADSVSVNVSFTGASADGLSTANAEVRIAPGNGVSAENVFSVSDSPERWERAEQTLRNLMTPDELQRANELLSQDTDAGNDAVALLKGLLASASAPQGSAQANDALAALRDSQDAHRQFAALAAEETERRKERAGKFWKTVYIAAGFLILCGLAWMLIGNR